MKWFVFLFVFVMAIQLASSAPPVTTNQQFTQGYTLKLPTDNILAVGQMNEFEIHVYNISDGTPVTSGICCYLHLYNSTGNHLLEMEDCSVSHNFDYSFKVGGGNVTLQTTTALFQCNSTLLGGFGEEELIVTQSGYAEGSDNLKVFFSLLFIILLGALAYVIIYSIGHAVSLDFDMLDLAINYGIYFMVIGIYWLHNLYLGEPFISNMLVWVIEIGAVTQIFLPTIYLILTLTIGTWMKRRVQGVDF